MLPIALDKVAVAKQEEQKIVVKVSEPINKIKSNLQSSVEVAFRTSSLWNYILTSFSKKSYLCWDIAYV
ncbi:hypothetical protein ABEY96_15735 [Priestia aryabhattai]|uniref:hypothetical protein n=1 Tax=Priestia aryabhattai TaxID=412384 RepID=UPI003D2903E1